MTTRVRIHGDTDVAKAFIFQGEKFLSSLKNDMQFNALKQGNRTVQLADGSVFKVQSIFGQDTIDITVPGFIADKEEVKKGYAVNSTVVIVVLWHRDKDPWLIVWDVKANAIAAGFNEPPDGIIKLDDGEYGSFDFPDFTAISTKLFSSKGLLWENLQGGGLYEVEKAGENSSPLYKTGDSNLISANTGCGTLTNTHTASYAEIGWQYSDGSWTVAATSPGQYWQGYWESVEESGSMKAVHMGGMRSYNLSLLGHWEGSTCVRTENNWKQFYYPGVGGELEAWFFTSGSPYPNNYTSECKAKLSGLVQDCSWKTPIAIFPEVRYYNTVCTRGYLHYPSYTVYKPTEENVSFIGGSYTNNILLQIFGYCGIIAYCSNIWNVGDPQPTSCAQEDYVEENEGVIKGAINLYDDVTTQDPLKQEENEDFSMQLQVLLDKYLEQDITYFRFGLDKPALGLSTIIIELQRPDIEELM